MKLLLDTHVVLWLAENSPKLSEVVKTALMSEHHQRYVSVASAWEIAIKISANKLALQGGLEEYYKMIESNGLQLLPVERKHIQLVETLPFLHRDPFDRLLISTALTEEMMILTADENIHKYEVPWIW